VLVSKIGQLISRSECR